MRINVVTNDTVSERILARLARELGGEASFTFSHKPSLNVDVNYYFPYLFYEGFSGTPTAAWFSHRDDSMPLKADIWDKAARNVGLRLTSAKLYADRLREFGPTALVTPPLDRDKFSPAPREWHERPVVGTSGEVYRSGRKGEALLAKLAESGLDIELRASGVGWPVPTKLYTWQEMQAFYQGLDLYLCTSTIEGIGYGPLEALACGVPVIIPRGVGIFDELPSAQNVFRYQAGDYDDMLRAVVNALAEPYNGESLRGITARFTRAAWQQDHIRAFEDFLYGAPPVGELPTWAGKAGVYVVAYRGPARDCARRLITSIRKHMPGLPVALASDLPGLGEDVFIHNADEDVGARSVKTKIYDLAPKEWDYVLYLDADTELTASIGFIFDLLVDGWEFVICTNPAQYVVAREMLRPDNAEECKETFNTIGTDEFLQYNGGVFAFRRNKRTARLVREWHTEWLRWAKRDQAALDRTLYKRPVRTYTLNGTFNCITRYPDVRPEDAAILHYPMQARSWRGMINGRLDSSEAWAVVHPGGK